MALLVSDHDGNSPKVWQPWYINADSEGVHKELPSRAHREQRTRERAQFYKHNRHCHNMNTVTDMEPVNKRVYGPPEYMGYIPQATSYNDDLPLDMSMKRRVPSPCQPASSTIADDNLYQHSPTGSCSPPLDQQLITQSLPVSLTPMQPDSPRNIFRMTDHHSEATRERPSVITCTSTRYLNIDSPSAGEKMSPIAPPPSYSIATAHLRENIHITLADIPAALEIRKIPSPSSNIQPFPSYEHSTEGRKGSSKKIAKRQLVQASNVDPEIDEHFRRSLGTHYQQFFSNSPPAEDSASNDSVDDHFTKALGETWRKLKANKEPRQERKSPDRFAPEGSSASFRCQNPQNTDFQGTADVSITRVSVTNSTEHGS